MPWIQIHVDTDRQGAGRVEALLEAEGALSVTVQDAADQPLLEPLPGETPMWDSARVTGLFEPDCEIRNLEKRLAAALPTGTVLAIEELGDQPWERAWLDYFRPMQFGNHLWVCPEGQAPEGLDGDAVVLTMDPGLAFGTGTHATTALCLEWLAMQPLAGKSVVDYGCGSGILGIAALLLGARQVTAIDHDPQALRATRDNALKNGVEDRLLVIGSDGPAPETADIVVANILATTLVELAGPVTACVRPGGDLVLSGILRGQAASVADAYRVAFDLDDPAERDGWILLHGIRRGS
jgi:ribosomal protein L11 methyltransferase